jgi:hypothetical protein
MNNSANSAGYGCGKAFGIGCASLVGLGMLSAILTAAGAGSATAAIIGILIIAGIVVAVMRSNKKITINSAGNSYEPAASQQSLIQERAARIGVSAPGYEAEASPGDDLGNPLCIHTFALADVEANAAFACPCGNYFEAEDIIKYNKLLEKRAKVNAQLFEIKDLVLLKQADTSLRITSAKAKPAAAKPRLAAQSGSASAALGEPRPSFVPTTSAPAPVPAPKSISKPKIVFSLQQWLIIAASLLVLIAGTVFVNNGIQNGWSFWIFALVTVTIGAVTAFGSFRLRKMSAVIASFLAAFSAAMQLATMSILGDQISNGTAWDFIWSSMPSWWWTISLGVVATISLVLARFSSVFGYKAIALLATTVGALIFDFGYLTQTLSKDWAVANVAFVSVTAVALALQAKLVRSIAAPALADDNYKEYAEDLAKREDDALAQFTRFGAPLQVLGGAGAALIATFNGLNFGQTIHLNPLAILILILVWAGISLTADRYGNQITKDGSVNTKLVPVANAVVYLGATVALVQGTLSFDNDVFGSPLTLAAIAGLALISPALRRFKPTGRIATIGLYLGAALWLQTEIATASDIGNWAGSRFGWFAVFFGFALTVIDRRFKSSRNALPATFINGLGLLAVFADFRSSTDVSTSIGFALVALAAVIAPNLLAFFNWAINGRDDAARFVVPAWASFGFSTTLLLMASAPLTQEPARNLNDLVGLAFAFMVYSAITWIIGNLKSVASGAKQIFVAHHYLGQLMSLVLMVFSLNTIGDLQNPQLTFTTIVAGLIVLNYSIGAVAKQSLKLQIGYLLMLGAFFINMWGIEAKWLLTVSAVQFLSVAVLTGIHSHLLSKRTNASDQQKKLTLLIGIGGSLLVGLGAQATTWQKASGQDALLVLALVALLAGVSQLVARVSAIAKTKLAQDNYGEVSMIYAAFGLVTMFSYGQVEREIDSRGYALAAFAVFALVTLAQRLRVKRVEFGYAILISNLSLGYLGASLLNDALYPVKLPEFFSVLIAISLIVSGLLVGSDFGKARRAVLVEVPILGTAAFSLFYSLLSADDVLATTSRQIAGSLVIAIFAVIKIRKVASKPYMATAYLASIASSVAIAHAVSVNLVPDFAGPEFYSALGAIALWAVNQVARKHFDKLAGAWHYLLVEVPIIGVAMTSVLYSLVSAESDLAGNLRQILGTAAIATLALVRTNKSKAKGWARFSYVGTVASALSIAHLVAANLLTGFAGPEVYSLLATAAIVAVHRVALKKLEFAGTMFSFGLPIGVALIPSTIYTYVDWGVSFGQLSVEQITRVLIVLIVSGLLLAFGLRRGNLANASMGIIGLTLLVVPITAGESSALGAAWIVQNTAMVIGLLVFAAIAIVRLAGRSTNNTRLTLGVPITIIMAPALFNSLVALGQPDLQAIDWWRFAILLTASLIMLVLGTLRETAGLFFPGLVGVLLSALPYGFKQTQKDQWFLWVLLLVIAGFMVWLAMRLERMRKQGRSSAAWLRELK